MSQGFKLRFDQMREGNPAQPDTGRETAPGDTGDTMHPLGYARNLCLVWPDGRRAFYNYAYLISAQLDTNGEMNTIRMSFSSETVVLSGYGLDILFMQLLDHLPRIITAVDKRYTEVDGDMLILEIIIEVR